MDLMRLLCVVNEGTRAQHVGRCLARSAGAPLTALLADTMFLNGEEGLQRIREGKNSVHTQVTMQCALYFRETKKED